MFLFNNIVLIIFGIMMQCDLVRLGLNVSGGCCQCDSIKLYICVLYDLSVITLLHIEKGSWFRLFRFSFFGVKGTGG